MTKVRKSVSKAKSKAKQHTKAAAVRAKNSRLSQSSRGFTDFVREQGVVGLAVGLAIGAAAGSAVKSIVDNFINPIVGFIVGGKDLSHLQWQVISVGENRTLIIGWGAVLSSVITLLATAFVIYQLVRVAKLDRLDKPKNK